MCAKQRVPFAVQKVREMSVIITLWLGPALSLNASIGRIRCERILDEPFRPPGLSVASRIVASLSLSMRPALRRALAANAREPGAGVGLENIGVVVVNGARKDWRLDECRSCCGWAIVEWLWSRFVATKADKRQAEKAVSLNCHLTA